jgi:hypothetical protein
MKWLVLSIGLALPVASLAAEAPPAMSPEAKPAPYDPKAFAPDPGYADKPYDPDAQLQIYGGKLPVTNPRPMLELGRPMYQGGAYNAPGHGLGRKNPIDQAFSIYGDWRTAVARNNNGAGPSNILATRLNLDVDWKLTGTERVHAFFRPLDHNTEFTRCERSPAFDGTRCDAELDLKPEALFFEGDLGAIVSGMRNRYTSWDLPVAFGKMPLLFQNGIWLEDAITGFAFTLPARNSRRLDISNMDVTFFAAFDDVDSGGVRDARGGVANRDAHIYGVTGFIEANQGYWELGYAYTRGRGELFRDQSYHNVAAAFTRRYFDRLSNSVRVIHNFGQDRDAGALRTANGTLLILENSLVTRRPLTLVPYLNVFFAHDRPQSVARAVDAGGILKNVGINFETDGLTGFPKLDDSGANTRGGALGVEYLFDLQQQLVFEAATVRPHGDASRTIAGSQTALGVRYQRALSKAWIARADVIVAERENLRDLGGIRFELRRKF